MSSFRNLDHSNFGNLYIMLADRETVIVIFLIFNITSHTLCRIVSQMSKY